MIQNAELILKEFQVERSTKENEIQKRNQGLTDKLRHLKSIQKQITEYCDQGGIDKLGDCRSKIAELEADITKIKSDLEQIEENIENITGSRTEINILLRNIKDNLQFRRARSDLREAENTIGILSRQIKNVNVADLENQRTVEQGKYDMLVAEERLIQGETKQLHERIKNLQKDYDDNFRDSTEKYLELKFEVKSLELSIEDLNTYYTSLDQ
jgi:chromosome segregation ATPase